jgi:hypothetical protein
MTLEKDPTPRDAEASDAEDVEGNSFYIGSAMLADMARLRSREIEREARERARAKEAKAQKSR